MDYTQDNELLASFAKKKNIPSYCTWISGVKVYNATTKVEAGHFYVTDNHIVKVHNGEIVEYYRHNYCCELRGASLDIETNAIIYEYEPMPENKGILINGEKSVYFGGYETIPEEYKSLLNDFGYKNNIKQWFIAEDGFIVHYLE